MTSPLGRRLFVILVALHPETFRGDFGQEMLLTYDEAAEEFGQAWMLWDCWLSLLRQLVAACLDTDEVVSTWQAAGLRSGVYPFIGSSRLTAGKLLSGTLLSAALYELIRPG